MNEFIYLVRALEAGNWFDSVARAAISVERGDVVVFQAEVDAQFFLDAEKARVLTDDELELLENEQDLPDLDAAVETKPAPKKKRKPKAAEPKPTHDEAVEEAEAANVQEDA